MVSLQSCKVACGMKIKIRHTSEVLRVSDSVPLSQSLSVSVHWLPTGGMLALCAVGFLKRTLRLAQSRFPPFIPRLPRRVL